ncbi:MAG: hypothetical protein NT157_06895 [Candidatus Micrarchaeota archaeon]|nr:hypothetical protein [Candidatus Micrarchaeota archaeon]
MDLGTLIRKYLFWLGFLLLLLAIIPTFRGDRCCVRLAENSGYLVFFLVALGVVIVIGIFLVRNKHEMQGLLLILGASLLLLYGILYAGMFGCCDIPEACAMPPGMVCRSYSLNGNTDRLNIELVNGLQKSIIVTKLSCTQDPSQYEDTVDIRLGVGEAHEWEVTCNDARGEPKSFETMERFSGKINLEYYFEEEGPWAPRNLTGMIYVEAN